MKLEGKTILITGANSGLGFAAAKRFAARGAQIILVCRETAKAEEAAQSIRQEIPNASLDCLGADLTSLQSVRKLIDVVNRKYTSLDILFNNAAVMKMKRSVTLDGFETMFQTNYLSPFLLSTGLSDLLKKNTPSQIINIAVPPQKMRVNFDDLQFETKFSSLDAFFHTKLYLLLFSLELADKLTGSGVGVTCLDPGPFRSNISREAPVLMQFFFKAGASADSASQYVERVVDKTDLPGMSGKVFVKGAEQKLGDYWKDAALRERLWRETEMLISRMHN